jgi:hypothetical protein
VASHRGHVQTASGDRWRTMKDAPEPVQVSGLLGMLPYTDDYRCWTDSGVRCFCFSTETGGEDN